MKKVLEMFSFGLQACIMSKRYVYCESDFSWWNCKHYIMNFLFQIVLSAVILLYTLSFDTSNSENCLGLDLAVQ